MDLNTEFGSGSCGAYSLTIRCRGAAAADTETFVRMVASTAAGAALPSLSGAAPQLSAAERLGKLLEALADQKADIADRVRALRRSQVALVSLAWTEPSPCEAAICAAQALRVAAVLRPCSAGAQFTGCQPWLDELAEWACTPLGVAYAFQKSAPGHPSAIAFCGALAPTCAAAVAFLRVVEAVLGTPDAAEQESLREMLCIENWPADVIDKFASAARSARLERSEKSIREDFDGGEETVRMTEAQCGRKRSAEQSAVSSATRRRHAHAAGA